MKVLSLFDGISCGMVALERAGIPVERYVAYEIEPSAIKISQKNYPQIEHCGDVTTADFTQYQGFDLLIGGSPCQDLSGANQNGKGLHGERSGLFWEYYRALAIVKPKHFLLENVASMKQERRLRRRPVCHECGERITEEYGFQFSGKWFCPCCIDQHKVYIDED